MVPANSVIALVEALLTLLQDEPRRLALGRLARQRVQRLFSMERFIQQYEMLYRRLGEAGYAALGEIRGPVQPGGH